MDSKSIRAAAFHTPHSKVKQLAKNPIVQQILAIGRRRREPASVIKAALETGRVESNFSNPSGGDADSAGWRQERRSLYPDPTNVKDSINRFYNEANKFNHGQPSYEIAAEVQRPAAQYRGRYRTASPEAQALLKNTGLAQTSAAAASPTTTSAPGFTATNQGARRQALQTYLADKYTDPEALFHLALNLKSATTTVNGATGTLKAMPTPAAQAAHAAKPNSGVIKFDGKPVAGWIAPILQYARQKGWKGTVTSGFRTDAEQTRIYDSGVRPAAVPKSEGGTGSNHEGSRFPLGAVDVSNAQQLAQILQNSPYAKKLVYAGGKDPVHFSHPHDGGY